MTLTLNFPSCKHAGSMRSWKCKEYITTQQQASETQLWYVCIAWRGVELCNCRPCEVPMHYTVTSWKHGIAAGHWYDAYIITTTRNTGPITLSHLEQNWCAKLTFTEANLNCNISEVTSSWVGNLKDENSCRYDDSDSHYTLKVTSAYFSDDDVTVCITIRQRCTLGDILGTR
jgi:hypothetical protein